MGRSTRTLQNYEKALVELSEVQITGASLRQELAEAKRLGNQTRIEELGQEISKNSEEYYRLEKSVNYLRRNLKNNGCWSENPDIRAKKVFVHDYPDQVHRYFKSEHSKSQKVQDEREAFRKRMANAGAAMSDKDLRRHYNEYLEDKSASRNRGFRSDRKPMEKELTEAVDDSTDPKEDVSKFLDETDPEFVELIRSGKVTHGILRLIQNDGYQKASVMQ